MMKTMNIRILMIAAFFAVMLMGCSSNGTIEEIVQEEVPIEFSSSANKSTRAAINSIEDLAKAGGFDVWGYKAKTASPMNWEEGWYNVFKETNVKAVNTSDVEYSAPDTENKTDATKWTYDEKRYWDKMCTYAFYAAAPTGAGFAFVSGDNQADSGSKLLKISGVTGGASDAEGTKDLLISRQVVIRNGAENTWQNVDFTFHHIMSKVQVKFATQINNAKVTVKALEMTGWDAAPYTFTQNANYELGATTSDKKDSWERSGNDQAGTASFLKASETAVELKAKTENGTTNIVGEPSRSYLMVPQAVSSLKFKVTYTIEYTEADGTKITDTFTGVEATLGAQIWATDCVTTYTLNIQPTSIRFSVSSVAWSGNSNSTVIVQ